MMSGVSIYRVISARDPLINNACQKILVKKLPLIDSPFNGLVEKLNNGTLKTMLRKLCADQLVTGIGFLMHTCLFTEKCRRRQLGLCRLNYFMKGQFEDIYTFLKS